MVAQTRKRRAIITPIFTGRSRRGLEGELVCDVLAAGFVGVNVDVGVVVEEDEGCEFEDCEVAALVWEEVVGIEDVAAALEVWRNRFSKDEWGVRAEMNVHSSMELS
jgi:hypothetical protein